MQQSGGLLLATGLDGGNTIILILTENETANQFPLTPPKPTNLHKDLSALLFHSSLQKLIIDNPQRDWNSAQETIKRFLVAL